ncbi:hypothetical protein KR026_009885, partial [Drosophila bipectinata]
MAEFLEQRCRTLEAMDVAMAAYAPGAHVGRRRGANNGRSSFIVTNSLPSTCALCGGWSHIMSACPRFLSMPPEIRLGEARRLGLCRKCLQTGHHMRECLAASCRSCGRRHHSLLHFLEPPASSGQTLVGPPTSAIAEVAEPAAFSPSTANALVAQGHSGDISLLATANIFVRSRAGSLVPCRALLDSGSQVHVITSRLASQLQLRRYKSFMAVSGIGDTGFATDGFSVDVLLRSHCSEYSALVNAVIAANITDLQPSFSLDVSSWNIPDNLSLADPEFFRPQRIDLLTGASLFYELLCVGQIKLSAGLPLLQKTRLGWVVCGGGSHVQRRSLVSTAHKDVPESATMLDDQLDSLLRRFWEIEDCSEPIVKRTKEELDCDAHFVQNVARLDSGAYAVRLPLKCCSKLLGESYPQAVRRFLSLERKLCRRPQLKEQYAAFIKEYLDLGHMSPVPADARFTGQYFLPHHCVLKEDSSTTKLRVVFDGSAVTTSGYSLNDVLMSGPVIQPKLLHILLRFRCHRVAITGDICKMYRCVRVFPEDSYLQCILWRDSTQDELQVFKLETVTYGTKPASFLAIRTMHQLADDEQIMFPKGA